MAERPVQIPDTLHVDLPRVDPREVRYTINNSLFRMTAEHWAEMEDNVLSSEMVAVMADTCMDIIQTVAEAILDVVMPQVYRFMTIYGTFSPSVLGLTEERIQTYLGDSIQHGLSNALLINIQNCVVSEEFSSMLSRHISETVNSVLALTTQTSTPGSRLSVFSVSSCLMSIEDLTEMVCHFASILVGASRPRRRAQDQQSQTSESELVFNLEPGSHSAAMEAYIIRMVKVLRKAQMPHRDVDSNNRRDVCVRVGQNTRILTVEDRESDRQRSAAPSPWGFVGIPGAVPDSEVTESSSESPPLSTVTVLAATEDRSGSSAMDSIESIAFDLTNEFVHEDLPGIKKTDTAQKQRKLADRVFNVVMSGQDYQIPSVPAGMRMMDTVTYRRLRGRDVTDPGIMAHTLYLRTEEVVARCRMQARLWRHLYLMPHPVPHPPMFTLEDSYDEHIREADLQYGAGDYIAATPSATLIDVIRDTEDPMASRLRQIHAHESLLTLVVGELLNILGIRDGTLLRDTVMKAAEELVDEDPELSTFFHAYFMGQHYEDVCDDTVNDLLLDFSSVRELQEAMKSGDPTFEAALMRALRKQWDISSLPVRHGKIAVETTCNFVMTLLDLCHGRTRFNRIQPATSLTRDQDSCQFEDHVTEEDNTATSKMAAHVRNMCKRTKKMCSSIARALGRPFACCRRSESQ